MATAKPLLLFKSASKCSLIRLNSSDSFKSAKIGIRWYLGGKTSTLSTKISNSSKKEAQEALLDYFHSTRGLRFVDAENISYNSSFFLKQLLEKADIKEEQVGRCVSRFLRYHPFNEFEPFFESLGLRPCEISRLIPRNRVFLSDDKSLLDNYYILCDFGIPRNKIGKIYENSRVLFHCDSKALISKLQAFSKLGFSNRFFPVFLSRTIQILSEKVYNHVVKVTNMIEACGIEMIWIEERLGECSVYNWSTMLSVLEFLKAIGYANEQLGLLIKEHPDILICRSGRSTLSVVCFLGKLGLNPSQMSTTLQQLNKIHIEVFYQNLRRFLDLFSEIAMDGGSIGHLFRSHTLLLGSCKIKKPASLIGLLKVGKKYLCEAVLENPEIVRYWAVGCKLKPLERDDVPDEKMIAKMERENFLLGIGYKKDSPQMKTMLRRVSGKASELQERFDYFVDDVGLSREEVAAMICRCPRVFNMTIDTIESKVKVFVEELRYPTSALTKFPCLLCYATERVRVRVWMYELYKRFRVREDDISIGVLVACSEATFVKRYVLTYPNGLKIWNHLKSKVHSL